MFVLVTSLCLACSDADIGDVYYSPMKAENTQLQETEWTENRQTY